MPIKVAVSHYIYFRMSSKTAIIINSITSGVYSCLYRKAIVRPVLKKTGLDPNEYKNYRPVSNLFFISKLIEKAVTLQLEHYLSGTNLLDIYQSGYRMYHSTETALLKITNDILMNQNEQCSTALVAIDLSAAFDLVNHSILLERLYTYYGISGTALEWFRSNLPGRTQSVVINRVHSKQKYQNTKYNAHTEPLFKMCNVLKFNDLYETKLLIFYHKLMNNNTSSNFLNFKPTISKANERYIIRSPKLYTSFT